MNYQRIHDQIVARAKRRSLNKETYTEKHHIVPKSMGGNNSKGNLVKLTAREHYLVHWLLYKIHRGGIFARSMSYAWHKMCSKSPTQKERYISYTYKYAKEARSATGHSEETKKKQRQSQLDYYKANPDDARKDSSRNSMYGKSHRGESKEKHRETLRNKPVLTCPFCNFSSNNYGCIKQFHFDNCKRKIA